MISLREVVRDLDSIRADHAHFVGARVRQVVSYYHAVFQAIDECDSTPRMSERAFSDRIEAANVSGLTDYKHLLSGLLKRGERVANIRGVHIMQKKKFRSFSDANKPAIIGQLNALSTMVDDILNIDISSDRVAGMRAVKIWAVIFDKITFLLPLIFDYEDWFLGLGPTAPWGPYHLTRRLGLSTCPYCNRIFTYTVVRHGGGKIARPQLDHFLPKSSHPILALSFFNLIPSCAICNASIKGSAVINYDNYLSPYCANPGHSLLRFSYIPNTVAASQGLSDDLIIDIKYNGDATDNQLKLRVENLVKLFCLQEVYANHSDIVADIIRRRFEAGSSYLEGLKSAFPGLALTHDDLYRYAYGTHYDEKDFHLRPLSKLTKDLVIELKSRGQVP